MKIILDAGHGQGSAHNRGSVIGNEGDNNYAFSLVLKKELEKYGIQVGLTRPNPAQDPSLNARGAMAAGYDMFISLHSNAATASVRGTEIYNSVQRPAPSSLVNALVADISKFFGHANRGVKTRKWNNGDYYGVLRSNLAKVGFLIEYGFHTNRQDAEIYVSKRQELAEITASRIASHYGLKKTSAPVQPAPKPTKPAQSSPTYYDYPPATYEVLRAINSYEKPDGKAKGKVAKGTKVTAIKEIRSNVNGVWLQLSDKSYIQAQSWTTVNVKKVADVPKPNYFKPYLVRVRIANLNIRAGAGTNHQSYGFIKPGVYTIVEEKAGAGASKWGKLKSGAGWISLDYTEKDPSSPSTPEKLTPAKHKSRSGTWKFTSNTNIRSGPSTSSSIISSYSVGQTVNILDTLEKNGYIWGQYIGATSGQKRYVALGTTSGTRYGKWV